MDILARIVVAALSVGLASPLRSQSATLSCTEDEASALRQAPLGAARVSPERLTVNWAGGSVVFADSGTEEGTLAGTAYRYCGFDATVGVHLIHKDAGDVGTGVLLVEASGRILPGGQEVSFAPDGRRYFATAQPDGLDGEEWYIYTRHGSQIWEGVSLIIRRHSRAKYDYSFATLNQPHWSSAGELQATLTCENGPAGQAATVTLTRVGRRWRWVPVIACPRPS